MARGKRLARLGALGLMGVLCLSGCDLNNSFWRFGWNPGITEQSQEMRKLWTGSVIAALVVGIIVWGLIGWAVVRYRKRGDELPKQTAYNLPLEVVYTIIPFIIIAVLFFFTVTTENKVQARSAHPDVTIAVNAFKWGWQFVYPQAPGADGSPVNTVGNGQDPPILVLPTQKTIRFEVASADVIHSFYVPEFLFKLDVIPGNENGRNNVFQVTVNKTGEYVGRCAELCGEYHAFMNFQVDTVTPDKYASYLQYRQQGLNTHDALVKIGLPGVATSTHPFDLGTEDRQAQVTATSNNNGQ